MPLRVRDPGGTVREVTQDQFHRLRNGLYYWKLHHGTYRIGIRTADEPITFDPYDDDSGEAPSIEEVQEQTEMSSNKPNRVKIGCDPEFFLTGAQGAVASCGIIGGTKERAVPIVGTVKKVTWLEDNVAVELNTVPAINDSELEESVYLGLHHAKEQLAKKNLRIVLDPSVDFPAASLQHPNAFTFGCEPDFYAYDGNMGKSPRECDATKFGNLRFAGGHLHLSYENKEKIPAYAIAMMMDALIGLPSICIDKQGSRRTHYGKAGLFRTKKYSEKIEGIEYRTLSNFWLKGVWNRFISEDYQDPTGTLRHSALYMFQQLIRLGNAIQSDPHGLGEFYTKLPIRDIKTAIEKEDNILGRTIYGYIRNLPSFEKLGFSHNYRPV